MTAFTLMNEKRKKLLKFIEESCKDFLPCEFVTNSYRFLQDWIQANGRFVIVHV